MNLEKDGFEVAVAENGREALERIRRGLPDLALVDLLLPDMHGFELSSKIKAYADIPIIALTAVDSEDSIVEGLDNYTDDYIVKPFRYRELRARINRILINSRHLRTPRSLQLVPGKLSLDLTRHVAISEGKEVPLTPVECRLLACLARNLNRVVDKERLIEEVWPDGEGDPLRLKVTIHRLRAKLERDPASPRYVTTQRGRGYMLSTS